MNINPTIYNSIQGRLCRIESGKFSCDDVSLFLIDIRDYSKGAINDLANFVTHKRLRDRGKVFKTANHYVTEVLNRIQRESMTHSFEPGIVYKKDEIVNDLFVLLTALKMKTNLLAINRNYIKIISCIHSVISDVPLDIRDLRVDWVVLKREANGLIYLEFKLSDIFKDSYVTKTRGDIIIKSRIFDINR